MKTDVIVVSNDGRHMDEAFEAAEKYAGYRALDPKAALHLRLLTEEMMGMMRSITGETEGTFWIEDRDGCCELHLKVETRLDASQREALLAASSTGRNEAARGFMGKIRALFESMAEGPAFEAPFMPGVAAQMYGALEWSMEDYRRQLSHSREQNQAGAEEAWDELERSVVAHVADDVRVRIAGHEAELIILKRVG